MGVLNLGNSTGDAHWQPEGNDRGTWKILQSCLITLGFCVYSSIHLNVPSHRRGKVRRFLNKVEWIFITTFFPEVAVYTAFVQRKDAVAMLAEMREAGVWPKGPGVPFHRRVLQSIRKAFSGGSNYVLVRGGNEHQKAENPEEYELSQAFFVCMGGLVFSVSEDERQIWPRGVDRMTLTPELIVWIARKHPKLIPTISAEMVSDKSKADAIVKGIAFIQATWFIAQFITRAAQKLPVTILELNTCVHTVYAVLAYAFWWYKPMDVSEPLCLSTQKSAEIRALCARVSLYMPFRRWTNLRPGTLGGENWHSIKDMMRPRCPMDSDIFRTIQYDETHALFFGNICLGPTADPYGSTSRYHGTESTESRESVELSPIKLDDHPLLNELQEKVETISFISHDPPVAILRRGDPIPGTPWVVCTETCEIDESTLRRLRWASELPGDDPPPFARDPLASRLLDFHGTPFFRNWLKGRLSIWRLMNSSAPPALLSTGIIYGALHLLILGCELQSSFWTQAWKVACIGMIIASPVVVVLYFFINWDGQESKLQEMIGILIGFVLLFYFFARLFIIVEVVWALFYSDPRVYQLPDWALYFPHIG